MGFFRTSGGFRALLRLVVILAPVSAATLGASPAARAGTIPTNVNKVVIVIEENRSYSDVINRGVTPANSPAPYINTLAANGANFTNATEVIGSPSQPNYIAFFGGKNTGLSTTDGQTISIVDNNRNTWTAATQSPARLITNQSLGGQFIASGRSFVGLSQTMPGDGSDIVSSGNYVRKHNPWTQFADSADATHNRVFTSSVFPTAAGSDYNALPTLSIIVPDLLNDMHDGTIAQGDTWLQNNVGAYATWAQTHNSLLIVTWDEGNTSNGDARVPLVMYGPMIKPGDYGDAVNNYNVLATIEDMYGLPRLGNASGATAMSVAFVPEPGMTGIALMAGAGLLLRRRRGQGEKENTKARWHEASRR